MSGTHAAVLTPPGTGAIGLIRVAGPRAMELVASLCRPPLAHHPPNVDSTKLRFTSIWDGDERVDEVVLAFPEWGEDSMGGADPVVDICPHGGVGVMRRILRLLANRGVDVDATKSSSPGQAAAISAWFETSNSRIRSEASVLMSVAKTPDTVRFLAWQRQHLPRAVLELATLAESDVEGAVSRLQALQVGYDSARVRIEGATVAIVGPPNAGKSTLINRLAGRDVAIVSEVSGTTRDWVDQLIDLAGVPITVIDTAGRRPDTDELQRRAIDAGCRVAKNADVTVLLLDGSIGFRGQRSQVAQVVSEVSGQGYRTVIAINKRDKRAVWDPVKQLGSFAQDMPFCTISAQTGEGVEILTNRILESCGVIGCESMVPTFFTPRQVSVAKTLASSFRTDALIAAGSIRSQLH